MRNTLVESQLRVSKFINYDDSAVKLIRRGRIAIKYNVKMSKQMDNCRIFWVLTVKFDISQKLNFIYFNFQILEDRRAILRVGKSKECVEWSQE
jgi:hypothetical protein